MGELEIPRSDENLEPQEEDAQAQRELEDATHEPRTYVEESGDYQQAEDIQAALTKVVENLGADAENVGDIPLPVPQPEEQGLVGGQSEVRGDLDEAETGGADKDRDEATPINLPGPQRVGEAPEPGPHPFPNVAHEEGDTQVGGPQEPIQQAHFEKPLLQEGLEDFGPDLGDLDNIEGMLPGPGGKIEGGPGAQEPGSDPLDDLLSGKGVPGGVDMGIGDGKMNFDPEGGAGEGHLHPATGTPFAPGKGPGGGIEMEAGGKKKGGKKDDSSESGGKKDSGSGKGGGKDSQNYPAFVVESDKAPKDAGTAFYDSKTGDFYFSTVQGVLERSSDLINMEAANILDGKGGAKTSSETTTTEDGDSGGPDRDTPNPKYDQEQISLHTADGTGAPQIGGASDPKDVQLTEEGQKRVKRALENMSKLRHAKRVKAGSEVVTDPPEHDPNPKGKSEKAGKEG